MDRRIRPMLRQIRRQAALKGVLFHLFMFIAAMLAAYAVRLDWSYFNVMLGWGLGMIAHILSVLGPAQYIGARWEERRLEELVTGSRPTAEA